MLNRFKTTRLRGVSRYIFELPEAVREDYARLQLWAARKINVFLQKLNDRILRDVV